jgi:hypothetical protein
MVVSVAEPGTGLVTALLLAQGGLVALGLILIDELDNAYGDVYSGSVSTHSLLAALEREALGPAARWRASAAMALDSVQPVPCVLGVAMRGCAARPARAVRQQQVADGVARQMPALEQHGARAHRQQLPAAASMSASVPQRLLDQQAASSRLGVTSSARGNSSRTSDVDGSDR